MTRQLERELLSQLEMELFDDIAEQKPRNKRDANDDLNDALKEITDKLSDFYSKAAIFFHQREGRSFCLWPLRGAERVMPH